MREAHPLAWWLLGAMSAIAFTLTSSALLLGALALVTFGMAFAVTRGVRRFAIAAGAATTLGLLFLWFTRQSIESCASFNRGGGRCDMGDSTPFVVIASLYLVIGIVLTALAALRARRLQ